MNAIATTRGVASGIRRRPRRWNGDPPPSDRRCSHDRQPVVSAQMAPLRSGAVCITPRRIEHQLLTSHIRAYAESEAAPTVKCGNAITVPGPPRGKLAFVRPIPTQRALPN